jgi:hypothetical protein
MATEIVCAWCGKHLGTKPGKDETSHGLCAECKTEQFEEAEQLKKERQNGNEE